MVASRDAHACTSDVAALAAPHLAVMVRFWSTATCLRLLMANIFRHLLGVGGFDGLQQSHEALDRGSAQAALAQLARPFSR